MESKIRVVKTHMNRPKNIYPHACLWASFPLKVLGSEETGLYQREESYLDTIIVVSPLR